MAFNLGMLGLAKLAEKGYGTDHGGSQYRRAISSMCRFVVFYPCVQSINSFLASRKIKFYLIKADQIIRRTKSTMKKYC